MTILLAILSFVLLGFLAAVFLKSKRIAKSLAQREQELAAIRDAPARIQAEAQAAIDEAQRQLNQQLVSIKQESERVRRHYETEAQRVITETLAAASKAQAQVDQQFADLKQESGRIRHHYEEWARRVQNEANAQLSSALRELEPLRKYEGLCNAEVEVQRVLAEALKEATDLREEAQTLLERSRAAAAQERSEATQKAREIQAQASAILSRATKEAGHIVEEAHKRGEEIAGDAYGALRDKERLEQAVRAIRNVVDGYGDKYIIPTRSLIDDLASDFGHTEAGQALEVAREHTRLMIEQGQAADCDYVEAYRRETAIQFVIVAFNGRVDAILTRTKHDNFGTLEQEIRDAFAIVNQHGSAFRDAHILPAFLEARIAELKWAVVTQGLKEKEREEQRRLREQMREEEKVRREHERAVKEAQEKEELIKDALEKARFEAEHATALERAKYDAQIADLNRRLAEAETEKQREMSLAEQTRAGHVYIISNVGSFGENVLKIGMTRRREPLERIWELGDASVPFEFDIHAMISTDDAPALERALHDEFEDLRINKVNYRKEFFKVSLDRIRRFVADRGLTVSFTMAAEAHEYRETQALNKMTPEQREKHHLHLEDSGHV
jgi:hypothetical protein